MEQPEDNTVYENETSECKEKRRGNFANPNFSGSIINKESIDVDIEDQDSIRSSIFSEYSERKERRQSKSSFAKDSIGEDDESKYDNTDIENPNPRMERRRSSVFSDYQERKERFANSKGSINKECWRK